RRFLTMRKPLETSSRTKGPHHPPLCLTAFPAVLDQSRLRSRAWLLASPSLSALSEIDMWTRIREFFSNSDTLWARIQMLGAAVLAVIATVDPMLFAGYIPTTYLPLYIFISGVITEIARRAQARDR